MKKIDLADLEAHVAECERDRFSTVRVTMSEAKALLALARAAVDVRLTATAWDDDMDNADKQAAYFAAGSARDAALLPFLPEEPS